MLCLAHGVFPGSVRFRHRPARHGRAADHLASTAGLGLLAQGGSAADAAVGAAAVMAVTSPYLCGMGGDMLAVVSAPGADPVALLATGRAGSGVDAAQLRAEGHSVMPVRGDFRTVPVPGAVDGWLALHARFGRLALAECPRPGDRVGRGRLRGVPDAVAGQSSRPSGPGGAGALPRRPRSPSRRTCAYPPSVARCGPSPTTGGDGFYGGEFGRNLVELGRGVFAED